MKEFIRKWSNWWILNPKRKQLDDAFEKELNELIEREAALRQPPVIGSVQDNSNLVDNMCMSYRHDFGFMAEQDKHALRFECKEWLRAYENNREHCH